MRGSTLFLIAQLALAHDSNYDHTTHHSQGTRYPNITATLDALKRLSDMIEQTRNSNVVKTDEYMRTWNELKELITYAQHKYAPWEFEQQAKFFVPWMNSVSLEMSPEDQALLAASSDGEAVSLTHSNLRGGSNNNQQQDGTFDLQPASNYRRRLTRDAGGWGIEELDIIQHTGHLDGLSPEYLAQFQHRSMSPPTQKKGVDSRALPWPPLGMQPIWEWKSLKGKRDASNYDSLFDDIFGRLQSSQTTEFLNQLVGRVMSAVEQQFKDEMAAANITAIEDKLHALTGAWDAYMKNRAEVVASQEQNTPASEKAYEESYWFNPVVLKEMTPERRFMGYMLYQVQVRARALLNVTANDGHGVWPWLTNDQIVKMVDDFVKKVQQKVASLTQDVSDEDMDAALEATGYYTAEQVKAMDKNVKRVVYAIIKAVKGANEKGGVQGRVKYSHDLALDPNDFTTIVLCGPDIPYHGSDLISPEYRYDTDGSDLKSKSMASRSFNNGWWFWDYMPQGTDAAKKSMALTAEASGVKNERLEMPQSGSPSVSTLETAHFPNPYETKNVSTLDLRAANATKSVWTWPWFKVFHGKDTQNATNDDMLPNGHVSTDDLMMHANGHMPADNLMISPNANVPTDNLMISPNVKVLTDNLMISPDLKVPTDNLMISPNADVPTDNLMISPNAKIPTDNLMISPDLKVPTDNLMISPDGPVHTDDLMVPGGKHPVDDLMLPSQGSNVAISANAPTDDLMLSAPHTKRLMQWMKQMDSLVAKKN